MSLGTAGIESNTSLGVMSRRPALPLVLVFAAGIALHSFLPHNAAALMGMTGIAIALAALCLSVPYVCSVLLAAAVFLCAVGFAQREHLQYPSNHIALFAGDEPRLAEV